MKSGRARELCRARPEGGRSSSDLTRFGAQGPSTTRRFPDANIHFPAPVHSEGRGVNQGRPKEAGRREGEIPQRGGELKAFSLVTGQYDAVAISDAPDDATVAKLALGNASMGFVRTETLRAFTEDEYPQIVGSLP